MNRPTKKANNANASTQLRLRISATAETLVRAGHPWIFSDSVREQNREATAGELGVIFDRNDKFLAVGFFDPESPIKVRVLHVGKPLMIDGKFWRVRLDEAVRRRDGLFDEQTTGYRVINGESDGWPGLVLDRYGETLVMKIYTVAWLDRLEEIAALIQERLKPEGIILRMSRNVQEKEKTLKKSPHPGPLPFRRGEGELSSAGSRNRRDGEWLGRKQAGPEAGAAIIFRESGIKFEADVLRGQKTGFFLDQRENRRIVESLARGRTVLNAFSFSGGFSLYAARGGAKAVTDLDISAHALESARRNFKLNAGDATIVGCRHEQIQTDAFEWLAGNAGNQFDLIVLDPPSLAKRETERAGAVRAYEKLAAAGIKHLSPGGILVACSCSAHVTAEEFFGAVRQSAARSGRRFEELQTTRHAPDHPASFKEAAYLKGIYLRLS